MNRLSLLIASVSAAILAYEVALMRALSVAQWHHFAYMVVSVALLGFGASGTLLSLWGERLRRRYEASMTVFATAFAIAIPASFALAQLVPFDMFQLAWDWRQYANLSAYCLVLFAPFLLGATCIGLAFTHETQQIHRLYCLNLLGSGLGSVGVVALMFYLFPEKLPLAAFAVAAAGVVGYSLPSAARRVTGRMPVPPPDAGEGAAGKMPVPPIGSRWWRRLPACDWMRSVTALTVLICTFMLFTAIFPLQLNISQYKALRSFLDMGAQVLERRTSPLGTIHVLDGPMIRLVPGLSLAWQEDQPKQRAILLDADSASAIHHLDKPEQAEIFDYTTSALPYHLLDKPRTLIIGAGGGGDVLLARYHNSTDITALELDPAVADLMTGSQADFAGHLYGQPRVGLVATEARGHLAREVQGFELIQLPLVESFGAAAAGVHSLGESYLYTVEALEQYLDHLRHGSPGLLCITRWLKTPPADPIRVLSTAVAALRRRGITEPGCHVIFIRSWSTATILISDTSFRPRQLQTVRGFCRERGFDIVWVPDLEPEETNRCHVLPRPYCEEAARALLSPQWGEFICSYPFDIRPTTDDRPYHSLTQGWRAIRYLREKLGGQWVRYADWGYIVLWATLAQAAILSAILILLPLFFLRRGGTGVPPVGHRQDACATGIYFGCLGMAYMFIEIVLMQKLSLFLASPIYSAAIVLAAFMVSSGLGSLAAGRRITGGTPVPPMIAARKGILGIVGVGVVLWFGMDWLLGRFAGQAFLVRASIAAACAGGLAFFMGMPFPSGLRLMDERAPRLVPWAWGVNGSASVVGAVLAMVLAVSFGFRLVLLLAFALYALAGAALPRLAPLPPLPSRERVG